MPSLPFPPFFALTGEKMRRIFFLFFILSFLFSGCAYKVKLVDFETGQTIIGTYNTSSKTVSLTLPSGELMRGQYSALTNATITSGSLFYNSSAFASAFSGGASAFGQSHGFGSGNYFGFSAGGSSHAYAILSGDKGTTMEMILQYNELDGRGFGEAKTNTGKEYKVIFPVYDEASMGEPAPDQAQKLSDEKQLTQEVKNNAMEWFKKSQQSVLSRNWPEAIRTASVAISLDPIFLDPYINRAWAYNEKGLFDKAIADCNKVLEIEPGNAPAINNRGVAYFRLGEKEKAIQEYRAACEKGLEVACDNFRDIVGYLPSEEIDVLLTKSAEFFNSEKYNEVITICSRIINLEPNNVTAFTDRCGAEANLGMLKEAKEDCLKSIELNPDYPMAYNNYGYVLEREGNMQEAVIYYEMSCGLGSKLGCQNQEKLTPVAH